MACFLVPTTEAVVITVATHVINNHEKKAAARPRAERRLEGRHNGPAIPWSRKLSWLSEMLWGGSLLLAFEHLWHGEIVPWFPFLTAASDPASTAEMLQEMGSVGVLMALIVTVVWGSMAVAAEGIAKRDGETAPAAE
ncbi:MAG: hypothetical protein LUG47_04810 [Clostridiales bacterium]|nr:hypothetical protein [Clostridiales bacterium]